PPLLPDNLVVADAPAARAAVARQARAGFDFVKVYTNLPASAYVAVLAEARSAGLAVAGHVPRGVGLGTLLDGGQRTLEHLQDFTRWIAPVDSAATPGWMRRYLA